MALRSLLRRRSTAATLSALLTLSVPVGAHPAGAAPSPGPAFDLVGVSWPASLPGGLGGTAQVRTRDARTGAWSPWRTLDTAERQPGSGHRTATEPLWTGPADRARTRLVRPGGIVTPLPAGARLERIADDGGTVDRPAAGGAIVTRSAWGADESLRGGPPSYGDQVKAVLVHHTAGSDDYACSDAPAVIRAIYRYHVRTNGWNDIGYNFLVDKCGRVYEGRYGGGSKPVIGAHALGFNTNTSGVAVLGDYRDRAVPAKVTAALARLARWKLGLAGHRATQKATLTAGVANGRFKKGDRVTVHRVAAHRDVYDTACPGDSLYAELGAVRSEAG